MSETSIKRILIIQTAFIGDVILSTVIIESLSTKYAQAKLDMLVRKGNENLLEGHPKLNRVWVWDKGRKKTRNQITLIAKIRKQNYDVVINLQRFLSSGLFTALSRGRIKIGFDKNPISFSFNYRIKHEIRSGLHETERNLKLLEPLYVHPQGRMRLYPGREAYDKVREYTNKAYIVIAATSVWFTKQYPANQWVDFINKIAERYTIYCIGAKNDKDEIDKIIRQSNSLKCINLSGQLSLLESAALMETATMNYVNDSAPMHLASAMNAPVSAIYCSTVPAFGFGPKSDHSYIIETKENLSCRPCGLHGRRACPEGHFNCAKTIKTEQLLFTISDGERNK